MRSNSITQTQMARDTGIAQPNISAYLKGSVGNVPPNWELILEYLGLELTALDPKILAKLEHLQTKHSTEWLIKRLELIDALEDAE